MRSALGAPPSATDAPNGSDVAALHEADIVFQASRSLQSLAIQLATGSRFSHMGLVHCENGRQFVYEAVGPVKPTPIAEWIGRGVDGHFVAMRLKQANRILTPEALGKISAAEARFRGLPYDFSFEWTDARIYCSELVWKVYKQALGVELGKLQRLGDFELTDPVVRAKVLERYGNRVPVDQPVISPAAIAASDLLEKVLER
jgi:hypothetical protein